MIIDGHFHILKRDGFVAETLREMDELGIDKTLLLGLPQDQWMFMGSVCGGNREVHEAFREHPDRFEASVYLDPREPDAIETLHRYRDAGFRGAKFHPVAGYFMDDPLYFPLYQELDELGWPATVHCGLTNIPYIDGSGRTTHSKHGDPIYLDGVVRRFPNVTWIIAHMAWPWFELAWGLVQFNQNVYMDLSGPLTQTNGLRKIEREGFGWTIPGVNLYERMIWGSDNIDTAKFFHSTRESLDRIGQKELLPSIFGGTIEQLLQIQ